MTLQQFLLILQARYKVILLTFLAVVLTTLAVSLVLPKQYKGAVSVVVDVKSPDPIAGMMLQAMTMPGYMATQIDIINSDRVAQKVVRLLKLDQSPAVQQQWKDDTGGRGKIEVWLGALLQKKLDVKPSRESNVIEISFLNPDPAFAAAIANAFAQAYIDTNIELRVEPAKQYAAWFDQQAISLRERLETAKAKLSKFQQDKGIVVSDERLNYENAKLMELQTQLVIAETQTAESSGKQKSGSADTIQDVMQNPVVSQLKSEIAIAESKLKEASGNLGKNHPVYKQQQEQLASLKQQMASEIAKITTSVNTSSRVSREKSAEIRAAIDAHKREILKLRSGQDEVSVLQQEVESAQKAYDAVNMRQAQSNLESQSTQTNISILTPASEAIEPASPKVFLNTLVAIFLGTLLGVGAALLLELGNRRIRSEEDLALTVDVPVLVAIDSSRLSVERHAGGNWFANLFRRVRKPKPPKVEFTLEPATK